MIDLAAFVRTNTAVGTPPLTPEIRLHMATDVIALWRKIEADSGATNTPPPYWAFAWAGGQAVARFILDRPETVAGRNVLDFGAGSGLIAIAAAKAGAAAVTAADIDAFAGAACRLNAAENDVRLHVATEDIVGQPWPAHATGASDINTASDSVPARDGGPAGVGRARAAPARSATGASEKSITNTTILIGDMCYERPLAERMMAWLRARHAAGAEVLIGDPGRNYFFRDGLEKLAEYRVQTPRDLEDRDMRETGVYRLI